MYISLTTPSLTVGGRILFLALALAAEHHALPHALLTGLSILVTHLGGAQLEFLPYALLEDVLHAL